MARQSNYPGIEVRGQSVRINFQWRGKTRKVRVPGITPTDKGVKQAAALREIIKSEIENGQFDWSRHFPNHPLAETETVHPEDYTVADLLNDWFKDQKGILSPVYERNSKWKIDTVLIPAFGHLPLAVLNSGHIRKWAKTLMVARDTIKNYLAPLRAAIREASDDKKLSKNPLADLRLPKEKRAVTKRVEKQREKIDPFSMEEYERILTGCKWPVEKNMFQFAFWSGVRPGELIALEWQDIDLKNKTAAIRQAMSHDVVSDIKTRAKGRRNILLLPLSLEALKKQAEHTRMADHGRIFVTRKNEPFSNYNQAYWSFRWACERAGVISRGIGQSRHTFASWMLMAGEDEMWVSKMLGHTTVEMVRKHYRKFIKDGSPTGYTPRSNWKDGSNISLKHNL